MDSTRGKSFSASGGLAGAPGTGGLPLAPSVAAQDLFGDALIANAGQVELDGRRFRALGGIPLLARLGQGGMGAVYYGIHMRLKKEVAVKVLPFHLAQRNAEFISRFYREAQIAANIQSAHLVNVLDVNEENGLSYIVMEYVNGRTAGAYLKELRILGQSGYPEAAALEACLAAVTGLTAAHAEGIVHRDVKPDNVLIPKKRGSDELNFTAAKLSDLGLAHSDSSDLSVTESGACMGTPGFMSPEQALDAKTCGPASDIFSLGATLYALLSGSSPFRVTGSDSALMKVLLDTRDKPHAPIRSLRPEISASTAALLDKCLAKKPADRYPDASSLAQALATCRAALNQTDNTVRQPISTVGAAALKTVPVTPTPLPVPARPAHSALSALWACGLTALVLPVFFIAAAGAICVVYFRNNDDGHDKKIVTNERLPIVEKSVTAKPIEVPPAPVKTTQPEIPKKSAVPAPPSPITPGATDDALKQAAEQKAREAQAQKELAAVRALAEKFKSLAAAETAWKTRDVARAQTLYKTFLEANPADAHDPDLAAAYARAANILGDLYSEERDCDYSDVEAVRWYRAAAEAGDALGQTNLALMYYNGDGVEKDKHETERWLTKSLEGLRKAAEAGDPRAQTNLGVLYENGLAVGKDSAQALSWYRKAAEAGYGNAQCALGNLYLNGVGVARNPLEAVKWHEKAAAQGQATSQYVLGTMYRLGQHVAQDELKAAGLFGQALVYLRKAAQAGNASAQYLLGAMTLNGLGLDKNEYDAAAWFGKAAAHGYPDAQFQLAAMNQYGIGVPINFQESARLYLAAANQNHAAAQDAAGSMYLNGGVMPKDNGKAREWFDKSAGQGYALAKLHLGNLYEFGAGVEKNTKQALSLYREAADAGCPEAEAVMGNVYLFGTWVARDYAEARSWYESAAEYGNADAAYQLGRMHAQGMGVPRNAFEATKWFRQGAERGQLQSMVLLALQYTSGSGVARNDKLAVEWFGKARELIQKQSSLGNATAQAFNTLLTLTQAYGVNLAQNLNPLLQSVRTAARNGDANCMDILRSLGE